MKPLNGKILIGVCFIDRLPPELPEVDKGAADKMFQPEWRPEEAPFHCPGADRQSSSAIFRRAYNVSERIEILEPRIKTLTNLLLRLLKWQCYKSLNLSDMIFSFFLWSRTVAWTVPPPSTPSSFSVAWLMRGAQLCVPSTSHRPISTISSTSSTCWAPVNAPIRARPRTLSGFSVGSAWSAPRTTIPPTSVSWKPLFFWPINTLKFPLPLAPS